MGLRIGLDMDGTVVDFTTASFAKVKKLYGIEMTKEDASEPRTAKLVWDRMTDEQKSSYNDYRELYAEICDPGFFLSLQPFDGAVTAVNALVAAGHEIVWITKVLNWERSAPEKDLWLRQWFPDIPYQKIMVDSVEAKSLVDVDVMVDDDPRVHAGFQFTFSILIRQPWNQNYRGKCHADVDSVVDALSIISNLQNVDECREKTFSEWAAKGLS